MWKQNSITALSQHLHTMQLIQSMYENARSRVCVACNLSKEFSLKVGVHQGSCLSLLLFFWVLDALSQEFGTECPTENLYADDLIIITEFLEKLQEKLILWKTYMEGNFKGTLDQHEQNQCPHICDISTTYTWWPSNISNFIEVPCLTAT